MASSTDVPRRLPLDDGGGESHVLELGHLEGHLARVGRETALVVAGALGLTIDGAFAAVGFDKTVSLLLRKGIEDVFDGLADEFFKLATHSDLIECYDGIGYWLWLRSMIRIRHSNHTEARAVSFLHLGYAAVKVCKRLYVTMVVCLSDFSCGHIHRMRPLNSAQQSPQSRTESICAINKPSLLARNQPFIQTQLFDQIS